MCCSQCKIPFLGVLALGVVALAGPRLEAQTNLRYQFKAGEKLPYEMEQKMKMDMTVGGQAVVMT